MMKGFRYLIKNDKKNIFIKDFLKRPFFYGLNILKAPFKKNIYRDNLFFFGIKNIESFKKLSKNKNLLIGFSYCQKPKNCPSKRFSKDCKNIKTDKRCKKCIIGKVKNSHNIFIITTINSLGEEILSKKTDLFLITACFFSINMFKHFYKVYGLRGIAIPLLENVCKNFKEFEYAEKNEKKEKTDLSNKLKEKLFNILK